MTVTYEEALASVLPAVRLQDVRSVALPDVVGEILARDVVADRDIPPFPRAAMDGYAVAWTGEEAECEYRIAGTVNPGDEWTGEAGECDCVKIMTGAKVPSPFDTVVPVEFAGPESGRTVRFTRPVTRGENVARQGEDVRKGAVVIPAGTRLAPNHVATLSSIGLAEVPVYRRPSVAVLATGSELCEPWERAEGPTVRNCNSHFLIAALKEFGFRDVRYLGIVRDDREKITAKALEGLESDFLIMTGGVSVGEVDVVPQCLETCGVRRIFHKIAVKPGKPIFAGQSARGGIVIGLPGNPVAVMVHFYMFIRPLLLKASGASRCLPKPIDLPLGKSAANKSGGKKFCLARLESSGGETRVVEIPSHGSGDFISAVHAEGVFEIPLGSTRLPEGHVVRFYPIRAEFLSES